MKYLLDTDTTTLAYYRKHSLREKIAKEHLNVSISFMTRVEILWGRLEFIKKAADGNELLRAVDLMNKSEQFLSLLRIVEITTDTANVFDTLRSSLPKKVGVCDRVIAAVAIANKLTLVTRNTKDFEGIPQLKLENWAD